MKTRAFTLIELLTVIAIIGILAAIIIPTVGRVRDSARTAQCASNLRQIGLATALYANENGSYPTITSNIPWPNRLLPYFSSQSIRLTNNTVSNLYSPVAAVFCPSVTIPPPADAEGYPRSYAANPNLIFSSTNTGNAARRPVRPESVKRPSKVLLFSDACQGTSSSTNSGALLSGISLQDAESAANTPVEVGPDADAVANNSFPRFRHSSRTQTVFVDGSVQSFGKGVLAQSHFSIAY